MQIKPLVHAAPEPVDLTNCDREPIHVPGSIQPHGAMLVCETEAGAIAFASANAATVLGVHAADLLGRSLETVFGTEGMHDLRNAVAKAGTAPSVGTLLGLRVPGSGVVLDAMAHQFDGRLLIEVEPASAGNANDALDIAQTMIRRIGRETTVDKIAESGARLVRATLGYDRVMVYRFLHNDAGRVIAESKRPDMNGFLGQHFPAADIPAQARRLYIENWMRVIGDVRYEPVPLLAAPNARPKPVDMSHAHLRSVSPIHCEYLRNMGVAASLSISIIVEGRLWGLIACHHDTPRTLPVSLRRTAEMFGQYFSLQIAVAERRAELDAASDARKRLESLTRNFAPEQTVDMALRERLSGLAALIPCDGAALWFNGEWTVVGSTPHREAFEPVLRMLASQETGALWDTNQLKEPTVFAADGRPIAGLLAIPVSSRARDYLLLFRNEEAQSVTWAGEPIKRVVAGPHGERLSPRGSFAAWQEDVRGRSQPWTYAERIVAEAMKTYLRDVALHHNEILELERTRAEHRRRILNDELNHRVKNILALVKSIATQTGAHAASVEEYSVALEGRLRALSYAHDQSLALDTRGDLSALLDAEASLHRYDARSDRVKVSGPHIGFTEQGFGALALVIHEMMTNAAKYGALSAATGRVSIAWTLAANGDCQIEWFESNGPKVSEPTRRGFGSTLIESAVTYDLGGTVAIRFAQRGLQAVFTIPARHVIHVEASTEASPETNVVAQPLAGMRILLIEDRALIALDTENTLRDLGASDVVAFPNVAAARKSLAKSVPDIAILDFNLGEETSAELADSLLARNIPFVFLTGYADTATIPARFGNVPVIRKPVDTNSAGATLAKVVGRR